MPKRMSLLVCEETIISYTYHVHYHVHDHVIILHKGTRHCSFALLPKAPYQASIFSVAKEREHRLEPIHMLPIVKLWDSLHLSTPCISFALARLSSPPTGHFPSNLSCCPR